MRLAFCLFKYYPFGGLERDCVRIAQECLKRGYKVDLYTMAWEGEIPEGISVNLIPGKGIISHWRCTSFIKQLRSRLQEQHYDLIVGFNRMPGLDVYYAADICYVADAGQRHGIWHRFTPRYRTFAALEKSVFSPQAATKVLLLSAPEQQRIIDHYGTPPERFQVLPPGIDAQRIPFSDAAAVRAEIRKEFAIKDEENILLMVGSDFKRKGVDRALLALAALPKSNREQTKLWVVGKGKTVSFLRLAKKLGIEQQVVFLGTRCDVGNLLLAADLLLHPAYQENTGTVILEALVAGLPVLTTANCGYAFHVSDAQAGLVVDAPYQQQIFNEYLLKMLNRSLWCDWKNNARHYAESSDLYSLTKRAVDLFEQFSRELRAQHATWFKKKLALAPQFSALGRGGDVFKEIFQLEGKIFRHEKNRKTLRFIFNGKAYFAKLHGGVGWKEIFKNLLAGRLPVIGAQNEWRAIQKFEQLGVPTMNLAGYGKQGWNPAKLRSFVITDELVNTISLEDFCRDWPTHPPTFTFKRQLIATVAKIARQLHENGVNHRDFYICHFLLALPPENMQLYVIDLHRVQIRQRTPKRWIVKDIAGLYFQV